MQQNNATYQVEINQFNACQSRVEARLTLRNLLLGVYDDVFLLLPEDAVAAEFNRIGHGRIELTYPAYADNYCGEAPVAP